ncbi:MAG TPA: 8-amino-7-oxononanoate synthase [Acidimicrobiales bacterium]
MSRDGLPVEAGTRASEAPDAGSREPVTPWSAWVDGSNRMVEAAGQWRRPRSFDARGPAGLLEEAGTASRPVVSFASNDYLGLTTDPEVVAAAHRALDRWGSGSGASRLVTGSRPVHAELEAALASWKECDRAVVFPTGFAANLSVLSVFGGQGAHVFSDELNHASIIDGCRLGRAGVTVYPHRDLGRLDALVGGSPGRPIIVTDTVFSMDGDEADLAGLVSLAHRHGALLVLDEAHAVLGPDLPGGARSGGGEILRMGTLSKALSSLGGFVAGPSRFVELLENRARPYIFTTAPTPADAAAALAALEIVRSSRGASLRARLAGHVDRVTRHLGRPGHRAPIIPVVIGDEADAVSASADLLALGLWVPAIRPPTVPQGTARLRITLSSVHTDEQVDRLVSGLARLGLGRSGPSAGGPGGPRADLAS